MVIPWLISIIRFQNCALYVMLLAISYAAQMEEACLPLIQKQLILFVQLSRKKECSHFSDSSLFWIVLAELAKQDFPIGRLLRVTIITANIILSRKFLSTISMVFGATRISPSQNMEILRKTIIHLVNSSEAGLTGKELGTILRYSSPKFCSPF